MFGDSAGEIAGDALDAVGAMLADNVCSSVDIVADVLGATITDLGSKGADALHNATSDEDIHAVVSTLTAAGGDLFTGVLKGTCDVVECLGVVLPDLSNAARNGIDAEVLLADLDAALVPDGEGKACVDAFAALADPVKAACESCSATCAEQVAKIVDAEIAAINVACSAAKSEMAARATNITRCVAGLKYSEDLGVKELFGAEKIKIDQELASDGTLLNVLASKYTTKCNLSAAASAGRTVPSAEDMQASVAKVRSAIQDCRADDTAIGCDAASVATLVAEETLVAETAASLSGEVTVDEAPGSDSAATSLLHQQPALALAGAVATVTFVLF